MACADVTVGGRRGMSMVWRLVVEPSVADVRGQCSFVGRNAVLHLLGALLETTCLDVGIVGPLGVPVQLALEVLGVGVACFALLFQTGQY
eukprot:4757548-Pyramimonas_sp.AAC.1